MATPAQTPAQAAVSNGPIPQPTPASEQAPAAAAKKPTGAELKAQKQAEKAKRRAQAIAAKEAGASHVAPAVAAESAPGGSDGKGGKQKGKHERAPSSGGANPVKPSPSRPAAAGAKTSPGAPSPSKVDEVDARDAIPECFSHLSMARRIPITAADKDIHPAVLAVGQQMAAFALRDTIARLKATLLAFKKVVEAYETPPGNAFSRHFMSQVLNPQIEYLTECRPMCYAMGNAIRLLKTKISHVSLEMSDKEASEFVCDFIDTFIHERIHIAEVAVLRIGRRHIQDGDSILTYGQHRLVRKLLERSWSEGVKFSVTVLDDPFDPTGAELVERLTGLGVDVTYSPNLSGLTYHLRRSNKVLLGTEAVFANGALYAPVGTSDIALAATALRKHVFALCESINIDRDRVATDSTTYNEIDPGRCSADSFRLLFDTTRDAYVSGLITEYEESSGKTPSLSVQALLRTKEEITA